MSVIQDTNPTQERKKVTTRLIQAMKTRHEPISMLTAYDYPTALVMDQAGMDMILVGDSLGMVMLGYDSTLPVTMDEMIHHSKAVARGAKYALLVGDMPFMSYQASTGEAVKNAGRFLQEAGMNAVKLEGGAEMADRMAGIAHCGIPVMGHLGLTPQSVSALGGFRVQGKDAARAKKIVDDAQALEEAGAFSILLEMVPDRVCELITERAGIPIISLGSGPYAHGQLLIFHDMFGLYPRFKPKMAKVYCNAGEVILNGLQQYVAEVTGRQFPQPENWFGLKDEQFDELKRMLDKDTVTG